MWRRKTILTVGGWQSRTTVEDMDLSLRTYVNGWKAIYLSDTTCRNEVGAHASEALSCLQDASHVHSIVADSKGSLTDRVGVGAGAWHGKCVLIEHCVPTISIPQCMAPAMSWLPRWWSLERQVLTRVPPLCAAAAAVQLLRVPEAAAPLDVRARAAVAALREGHLGLQPAA